MNSINNRILIAMPHMDSPFFKESVIFMCEHDKNGAMGLIVNKPLDDQAMEKVLAHLPIFILGVLFYLTGVLYFIQNKLIYINQSNYLMIFIFLAIKKL